jgi:Transposase DDE domain
LSVAIHPANIQDRDGAGDLLRTARRSFPFIERIFADAGYQGTKMAKVVANTGIWTLQVVKRSDAHRFVVLPSVGSSSAPSRGSAETAASPATSSVTPEPSLLSSASP